MKLSNREKVLLYIMVCVAIVGIGFLVIQPVIKTNKSLENTADGLEMEVDIAEAELIQQADLQKALEEKKQYYKQHINDVNKVIDNDYIEQSIVKLIEKHNLSITSSSFDRIESVDKNGAQKAEGLIIVTDMLSLGGNVSDFIDLIDECKNEDDFIVDSFSIDSSTDNNTFAISIGYYMADDLEIK